MGIEEYKAALKNLVAKRAEFHSLLLMAGTEGAIDKYVKSTEFEEEACLYCREIGWEEPR